MNNEFIQTVQKFVARESVGPSALRNQGQGVLSAVHHYLDKIDLAGINAKDQFGYIGWLDRQTENLLQELPVKAKPWGAARKAMNLFMRTALYNRYLNDVFKLETIERWMEIPLDSAVTAGLKKRKARGELPRWPGLKKLTREISDQFQRAGKSLAISRQNIAPVHLDMYLWMENR